MKKQSLQVLLMVFLGIIYSHSAQAWLIMKLSNMAEDITTFTTKVTKNAQKQLDNVATLTVVKQIGKGFQETKAWMEDKVASFKSFSSSVQKQINKAKELAGKLQESVGDYTTLYNDLKELNKEYNNLTEKIENERQNFNNEIEALESVSAGKIAAYQSNLANLDKLILENPENKQSYESQKASIENQIKAEQESIKNLLTQKKQAFETLISGYETQLKSLEAKLDKVKADLELIAGLTGEEQSSEESLTKTARTYFLKFDEIETPQRQEELRINRLLERRQSIIDGYSESIKYIPQLRSMNYDAETLGYNASAFDTVAGAWGASAVMQIQNLKALSSYAHLLVYDIKRQTAVEVANLRFYKLEKDIENIRKFNIDDYMYDGGDK